MPKKAKKTAMKKTKVPTKEDGDKKIVEIIIREGTTFHPITDFLGDEDILRWLGKEE